MILLRGHHLLCSLTFAGHGYNSAFVRNYAAIVERLREGEPVRIVEGPDAICEPIKDDPAHHCHEPRIAERDRRALRDISGALGKTLQAGATVVPSSALTASLRRQFRKGTIRSACEGCQWKALCDRIGARRFAATVLLDPREAELPE